MTMLIPQVDHSTVWCPNSPKSAFYQSDLELDQMTLIFKLNLDMVRMSHNTKMKYLSKVIAQMGRQTDTHADSVKILPFRTRGR